MKQSIKSFLVFLCLLGLTGCGKSPSQSYITKFGSIPDGAKISKFWFSGIGMDHSYLWKIEFDSKENYDQFIKSINHLEDSKDESGPDTGLCSHRFPRWWKEEELEKMNGKRKRGNNIYHYYFYIDHAHPVYIQWFDT